MKNRKEGSKKALWLLAVVVTFTFTFFLMIKKESVDNNLGDIKDNNFSVMAKEGEVIVAKDAYSVYPKYYVAYVSDNNYSIYTYNYYDTASQYKLEYNRLIDKIVEYDEKEKMIRYLESKGYGSYDEVLNNFEILVDSENLIFY